MKLEFSQKFSNDIQILNFMKIRPVGIELFHAEGRLDERTDGRTDGHTQTDRHDEANSRFSKFSELV